MKIKKEWKKAMDKMEKNIGYKVAGDRVKIKVGSRP